MADPRHPDSTEPSPAQLGETMTLDAGEWTSLDDHGTQIYLYGEQPVDIAFQTAAQPDEIRQLRTENTQLHAELDAIGGMRIVEHNGSRLRVITRALHNRLCRARVATPQEDIDPDILHCAFCGLCYPKMATPSPDYGPVKEWSDIAYEMWAVLCNSATDGHSTVEDWTAARDRLRDRFHTALATLPSTVTLMKIEVRFTLEIPDDSLPALCELAAVETGDRTGARHFVQAEAEQNIVIYLTDNGVTVTPTRGTAFPADYPDGAS
jgi:hypothetical protein